MAATLIAVDEYQPMLERDQLGQAASVQRVLTHRDYPSQPGQG